MVNKIKKKRVDFLDCMILKKMHNDPVVMAMNKYK